jgi:hypothetical protein
MNAAPAYAPILGSADVSNRQSAFPSHNHPIGLAVSIWDCRTFSKVICTPTEGPTRLGCVRQIIFTK